MASPNRQRVTQQIQALALKFGLWVGQSIDQDQVEFIVPNLDADLPYGVQVTVHNSLASDLKSVRRMYPWAREYMMQLDAALTDFQQTGNPAARAHARAMLDFQEVRAIGLGYVVKGWDGNAMPTGSDIGERLFTRLLNSPQYRRGLIVAPDLIGAVRLIGLDRSSDALASIIMDPLIDFNIWCAEHYQFDPSRLKDVTIPRRWNRQTGLFDTRTARVLVNDDKPILLLPKILGRSGLALPPKRYVQSLPGEQAPLAAGETWKDRMMTLAEAHPGTLETFAEDYMSDIARHRERREFRPPNGKKSRRRSK